MFSIAPLSQVCFRREVPEAGFWGQRVASPAVGLLTPPKPGGTRGELALAGVSHGRPVQFVRGAVLLLFMPIRANAECSIYKHFYCQIKLFPFPGHFR